MATALVLAADGRRENGRWRCGTKRVGINGSVDTAWEQRPTERGIILDLPPDLAEPVVNGDMALDAAYRQALDARDREVDRQRTAAGGWRAVAAKRERCGIRARTYSTSPRPGVGGWRDLPYPCSLALYGNTLHAFADAPETRDHKADNNFHDADRDPVRLCSNAFHAGSLRAAQRGVAREKSGRCCGDGDRDLPLARLRRSRTLAARVSDGGCRRATSDYPRSLRARGTLRGRAYKIKLRRHASSEGGARLMDRIDKFGGFSVRLGPPKQS
jgi:hypothetical protein